MPLLSLVKIETWRKNEAGLVARILLEPGARMKCWPVPPVLAQSEALACAQKLLVSYFL